MEKLSKPPVQLVTLRINFPHNLRVSEKRSAFHELIKAQFPSIVLPEIRDLKYDFSDCYFRSIENAAQVRIATNYFVLETVHYQDVFTYWELFKSVFSKFSKLFDILEIDSLRVSYDNVIKIDKGLIGEDFSDYFSLAVAFRNKQERKFVTVDGSLLFAADDGFIQIEIHPKQNPQTMVWDSLQFKIDYQVNKKIPADEKLDAIKEVFDHAHKHIEDLFVSSLTEKYFKTVQ